LSYGGSLRCSLVASLEQVGILLDEAEAVDVAGAEIVAKEGDR
jgi:hypothetical protein